MKTLYEAANAVEAHMLVDVLGQQGIPATVHGEHLQGGVGELPAAGLVRVMVDDDDHAAGRAVIARWEASAPKETPPPRPRAKGRGMPAFVAGLVLGLGVCYAYFRVPAMQDGIDYDGDLVRDESWTFSPSGRLLTSELDRNFDGRVDQRTRFGDRGLPVSVESDDDFDGTFETRSAYRDGQISVVEQDLDGDMYFEIRTRYQHGVAVATDFVNPSSGQALRVEHYRLGKLDTAEVDSDQDGRLDTRIVYGPLNEVVRTEKILP